MTQLCACYWCHLHASVEGYCRECFLYCMEDEPSALEHPLLARTEKALVSLYNWNKHKIRQRRSDGILKEAEECDEAFARDCPRLPKAL